MSKKIYVGDSKITKAGRGVFASVDMKKNTVIEVCPILIMDAADYAHLANTILKDYDYEHNKTGCLLALGNGSLYNHNALPNAKYELSEIEGSQQGGVELCITAIKPIAKDDEIYINYGNQFNRKFSKITE